MTRPETGTDPERGSALGGCGCSDPGAASADTCYCTVDDLVGVISRKHALSLINFLGGREGTRFGEMEDAVEGISSSTLSETLSDLHRVGLVSREVFPETPPRVEYALTEAGRLLRRRFRRLLDRIRETPESP